MLQISNLRYGRRRALYMWKRKCSAKYALRAKLHAAKIVEEFHKQAGTPCPTLRLLTKRPLAAPQTTGIYTAAG